MLLRQFLLREFSDEYCADPRVESLWQALADYIQDNWRANESAERRDHDLKRFREYIFLVFVAENSTMLGGNYFLKENCLQSF